MSNAPSLHDRRPGPRRAATGKHRDARLYRARDAGRSAAPPTVYRALDFLLEQGFVHRLATSNTYLACAHPQHAHAAVFLVCSECGQAQEVHTEGVIDELGGPADVFDFAISHAAVEATGLCRRCRNAE